MPSSSSRRPVQPKPDQPQGLTQGFDAEQHLRHAVRSAPGLCIVTGGQTGVDTIAAATALAAGIDVHLVFPRGFRQEDGPLTSARRTAFGGATLHELVSPEFRYRTWTVVYLADAVILLDPGGGDGCAETARAAARLDRPLLTFGAADAVEPSSVTSFLERAGARVLTIAGCRASVLEAANAAGTVAEQLAAVVAGARAIQAALERAAPQRPPV